MPAPAPSSAHVIRSAAALGLAAGSLEVGLRAAPRLGMDGGELLAWLGVSALLSLTVALGATTGLLLVRRLFDRLPAMGLVAAALFWIHAALFWRLELHVNAFSREPVVWGGLLAITAFSLLLGWLLEHPLRRAGGWMDAGLVAVALLGAATTLFRGQTPGPSDQGVLDGPNVLLITLDTVRYDALEPFGGPVDTPTIADLTRQGAAFDQAVACAPLTEASHLAMLTGLEPTRSGVVSNGTDFGEQPALVSHAFQRAGWATGGFVAGFPLHGRWGWTQGFDVYDDDFGVMPGLHRLSIVKAWDQVFLPGRTLRERRGDAVVARTLHWLDAVDEGPWFAWVHLFDPHGPYEAPAPFDMTEPPPRKGAPLDLPGYWPPALRSITSTEWLDAAYHQEIRYADHQLGLLLASVAERAAQEDTLVLLTADHGESLTEHDYLFDHGDNLFDPSLRVPFVVQWPGHVPANQRVPCQVSTVDVAPTLLDAAGLDPSAIERDGRSLLPVLLGHQDCEDGDAFATTVAGRLMADPPLDHALRGRGRKLVAHEDGTAELYDLERDPGELLDVAPLRKDEAAALQAVLATHLEGGTEIHAPSMGEATQEALRALGYIE